MTASFLPDREAELKWCSHCERQKPVAEFYRNGAGRPNSKCKLCHRWEERVRFRRCYRRASFRRLRREAWVRYQSKHRAAHLARRRAANREAV